MLAQIEQPLARYNIIVSPRVEQISWSNIDALLRKGGDVVSI